MRKPVKKDRKRETAQSANEEHSEKVQPAVGSIQPAETQKPEANQEVHLHVTVPDDSKKGRLTAYVSVISALVALLSLIANVISTRANWEAAKIANRAYVVIDSVAQIQPLAGMSGSFMVSFANVGKTPARNVEILSVIGIGREPAIADYLKDSETGNIRELGASRCLQTELPWNFDSEDIQKATDPDHPDRIYSYIRVEYDDVFGRSYLNEQTLQFAFTVYDDTTIYGAWAAWGPCQGERRFKRKIRNISQSKQVKAESMHYIYRVLGDS